MVAVQVIRGPRPKSENWPRANPSEGGPGWHECTARTPDARVAEARVKVSKLEKALNALEGTSGAEVEAIKKALVKAAAHEKPLTELIVDCKGFIDRAEKRLVKLEVGRRSCPSCTSGSPANACSTFFRIGGVSSPRRVGQCAGSLKHQCRPPTPEETLARVFFRKHCRGGSVVDEMPATKNGGSNFDGPRGRHLQVCLCDCGRRSRVAAVDSTTFKCWEHGGLRVCVANGAGRDVAQSQKASTKSAIGFVPGTGTPQFVQDRVQTLWPVPQQFVRRTCGWASHGVRQGIEHSCAIDKAGKDDREAKKVIEKVEAATAPFQHALSTKAGCECVAHVLQATIMSIDGVGAHDLVSQNAMLEGFLRMDGGD